MANSGPLDRLAPYERRVIELLRNSKDKRARKLAKKRVRCISNSAEFSAAWVCMWIEIPGLPGSMHRWLTGTYVYSSGRLAAQRERSMSCKA